MTVPAMDERYYLDFFRLNDHPFPVAPDEEHFYISEHIEQVLTEIIFGIDSRKGFMALTGEVGLGKTTIGRRILRILERRGIETSLVFHTAFEDVELIREINRDFGLNGKSRHFGDQMALLNRFLMTQNQKGKNCAIIIDDAQNLSFKSLELVRMISNLEADQKKLVQIVLIGQPELMEKLNRPKLRQLKSRIVIQKEVKALTGDQLKHYLFFKFNQAGNNGRALITASGLQKVHRLTCGNFRQVNLLMDRCLHGAFLYDTHRINKKIVMEAYGDLYPDTIRFNKKPLIWLTAFLAAFCFWAGMLVSGLKQHDPVHEKTIQSFSVRPQTGRPETIMPDPFPAGTSAGKGK